MQGYAVLLASYQSLAEGTKVSCAAEEAVVAWSVRGIPRSVRMLLLRADSSEEGSPDTEEALMRVSTFACPQGKYYYAVS